MENLIKKIKQNNFADIIETAKMENGKFIDFKYFTIKKDNMLFYIQYENYGCGFEVIPEKICDFNHTQQVDYPQRFYNFKELKEIILQQLLQQKQALAKTFPQVLFHELYSIYEIDGFKTTIFEYLKKIMGNREKVIFENIDRLEHINNENDEYFLIKFISKNGDYFTINTRDIKGLIVE